MIKQNMSILESKMVDGRTASIYGSGEHRLPACSSRQLAETLCVFVAATSLKVAGKLPAGSLRSPESTCRTQD
jgi:hypothetical protein